jgi:hypothetical protein
MSDATPSDVPVPGDVEGKGNTAFARIELVWPGKDVPSVPRQEDDGRWRLDPRPAARRLHPLVEPVLHGDPTNGSVGLVVSGERLAALSTLRRRFPRAVTFAYLDVPRIEIDDQTAAFRGDPTYAYSTWFSVLRAHLDAVLPLMSRAGVVAMLSGDIEEPYARLLLGDALGRDNYIGTIVWQRSYGPRNMRGMKEFTATHDCIVLFSVDKGVMPAVGLRRDAEEAGFANPDGDPRQAWRAAHKGARTRREKSDFNTYVPPYRWRVVDGDLPEGLWRLNPLTGVIWGPPTEVGEFPLVVEVTDSAGGAATAKVVLRCGEAGAPPELPPIPWVFEEVATKGKLRVASKELPEALVNKEYSAVLLAAGGTPYTAAPKRPGSGRYWEFADDTLKAAYARDMVDLGADGDVIPRIKTYATELGEEVVQNQQTWWPAKARDGSPFAGFTQDATKHLKKLRELGFIGEATTTSKPEHLLARLLSIFTRPGDLSLEMFGSTADLAAVALKLRRDFVYLSGATERERALLADCAIGRLEAVADGKDNDLHERDGEIRMSPDAYLPFAGGGGFASCRVGDWLFEQGDREDFPHMNRAFGDAPMLASAVLTAQGFLPDADDPFHGSGADGSRAVVVPPEEFLTPELASRLVSASEAKRLTIFYFMASDEFDPSLAPPTAAYRRVPTEIALFER